jgi:integrase
VVQEILGHASMVLTADTYSHVTPSFKRQAADALAAQTLKDYQHAGDKWYVATRSSRRKD